MSKPTFLTVKQNLAFRNLEHFPHAWIAFLDGQQVTATEADTERGYVDVVRPSQTFPPPVDRLFGRVTFRSRFEVEKEELASVLSVGTK